MNTFHGLAPVFLAIFLSVVCHAAEYKTYDISPPFPSFAGVGETPEEADSISLPIVLGEGIDRAYWDLPLKRGLPQEATSLVLESSLSMNGFVTGMTLHLRSGMEWYSARIPLPSSQRGRVAVPLSRFKNDAGKACESARADILRISIWCSTPQATGTFVLNGLQARRDVIALVDTGEDASLVRCRSLFDEAGIPYTEIDDDFTRAGDFSLVVIPTTPATYDTGTLFKLKKAIRSGAKFMVFYTSSKDMSSLLGILAGEWKGTKPDFAWISMIPKVKHLVGFSELIPHETTNIIPPYEGPGAVAVAFWSDSIGRETKLPACVVSEKGAWFAHLPPLPTRPAAEFMRRLCLRFAPELAEVFAVKALMDNASVLENAQQNASAVAKSIREAVINRTNLEGVPYLCMQLRNSLAAELQRSVASSTGEVHAVWDARAPYRSEATWVKVLFKLDALGINLLFAQVGNVFSSDAVFNLTSGLPIERVCDKARMASVSVHAWIYALSIDGLAKPELDVLAAQGRLIVSSAGIPRAWLCPVNPENRKQVIDRSVSLAGSGVSGIHLDYIRYPDEAGCFCAGCRAAFERTRGAKVENWPSDVLGTGLHAKAYRGFQTQSLTELVAGVSEAVRQSHTGVALSAAVFPEVSSAAALGQDWPRWVTSGLVDFVCPMTYQSDKTMFASQVTRALAACAGKGDVLLPGIGTTADVAGPDAYGVAEQILETRKLKCRGFAFFSLDDLLFDSILPNIQLNTGGKK